MARLSLTLLGGLQARLEPGGAVALPMKKGQALLAYLAVPIGKAHPRGKLAALLWGGIREESARNSLRQALFGLRKVLVPTSPPALVLEGDTVALDREAVNVDVAEFESLVSSGTPEVLERASGLYRGDLLAGIAVDEPPFEEWLRGERERLRELALETLAKLLAHQRSAGTAESAVKTALRLLTLDPLLEAVHRTLMQLYAQLGRRSAALRQYQVCVGVLRRELGVEPEAETKALYQEILHQRPQHVAIEPTAAVRGARPVAHAAPGAGTSLIGRAAEMERLRAELEVALTGAGRVTAVIGEAGVGKSRLAAELAADAAGRGVIVLFGRSYESEQILPFGPWVDAVRTGRVADDRDLLMRLGGTLRSELARLLPEIGDVPSGGATDARLVFESVTQLINHLAARQPVLLVLEDLHWADAMSARLLAFAGRQFVDRPAMILVTAREEEMSEAPTLRQAMDDLQRDGRLATLALRPLSRPDTLALVRALARLSDEGALARLAEQVWAVSEGNPFVAVETVRAHAEDVEVGSGSGLALPERVREIVSRRLERLSEATRFLAAVAAIIGREFDFNLLQRSAGLGADETAAGVEELVRRGLLQGRGERFDFTHDWIREVVSSRLLAPRRKLLHLRVAEALEVARPQNPEVEALAIGLHYQAAEVWDKAVEYLRQASKRALQRGAYRESASSFETALAALGRLPESSARTARAFDIMGELRSALIPLGDLSRQMNTISEMVALADALGDRGRLAKAVVMSVYTLAALGDYAGAIAAAKRGRVLATESGDLDAQVTSDAMLGRAYYALGQYPQVIAVATQAFTALPGKLAYDHFGRTSMLQSVGGRVWVAMSLAERGRFPEATALAEEAMQIAEVDQGKHERVWSRVAAGRVALVQGEVERTVGLLEPILPLAQDNVDVYISRIASMLGAAHLLAGRKIEALPLLERAAEHGHAIGLMDGHSLVLALLAEGHLRAERCDAATRTAGEALALARQYGERGWEAWTLRVLGEIAAERSPTEAADHYREALALASELGMRPLQAHCHLGVARVTGAADERTAAVDLYRAMNMRYWLEQAEKEIRELA